jgi:RNA polymerase sigma-70 factor (ECF subfamily)
MVSPLRTPRTACSAGTDVSADAAPDAALVERIRAGDDAAFEDVVRTYFTPLVRFGATFLGAYEAAEDLVQEVLCRVWQQGAAWQPQGSIRAYLFAAVRNRALNALEHRAVEERFEVETRDARAADADAPHAASAESARDDDAAHALRRAVQRLSARQRDALRLRYEDRLTVPEVAGVLGVSVKAAEKVLARAVHTLRAAMRDPGS